MIENLGKDEDQRYLVGKNASVALFYGHGSGANSTNEAVATEPLNRFSDFKVHVISISYPWHGKGPRPHPLDIDLDDIISTIAAFLKKFVHPDVPIVMAGHSFGGLTTEAIRNRGSKVNEFYHPDVDPLPGFLEFLGLEPPEISKVPGVPKVPKIRALIGLSPVYNPYYDLESVQRSYNIFFGSLGAVTEQLIERFNQQKNENKNVPPEMFILDNLILLLKIAFWPNLFERIIDFQLEQKPFSSDDKPSDNIPTLNMTGRYDSLIALGFDQFTIRMNIFKEITGLPINSLLLRLKEEGYSEKQAISNLVMSDQSFLEIIEKVTNKTLDELKRDDYTEERILAKGYEEYFKNQKNLIFILLEQLERRKNTETGDYDVQHMLPEYLPDERVQKMLNNRTVEFLTHRLKDGKYQSLFENGQYDASKAQELAEKYVKEYGISLNEKSRETLDTYISRYFMSIILGKKIEVQDRVEKNNKLGSKLTDFIQYWITSPEFAKWAESSIVRPKEEGQAKGARIKNRISLTKSIFEKKSIRNRVLKLINNLETSTSLTSLRSEVDFILTLLLKEKKILEELEELKEKNNKNLNLSLQNLKSYKLFVENLKNLKKELDKSSDLKSLENLVSNLKKNFSEIIQVPQHQKGRGLSLERQALLLEGHSILIQDDKVIDSDISLLPKFLENELISYYLNPNNKPSWANKSNWHSLGFKDHIEKKLTTGLSSLSSEKEREELGEMIRQIVDSTLNEYYIPTEQEIRIKIDNGSKQSNLYPIGKDEAETKENEDEFISNIYHAILENVINRLKITKEIREDEEQKNKLLINAIEIIENGNVSYKSYSNLGEEINTNIKKIQKHLDIYRVENPSNYPVELHEDIRELNEAVKVFIDKANVALRKVDQLSVKVINQQRANKNKVISKVEKDKIMNEISEEIRLAWRELLQAHKEYYEVRRSVIKKFIITFRAAGKLEDLPLAEDLRLAIVSIYGSKNQEISDYEKYIILTKQINELEQNIEESNQNYFKLLKKYVELGKAPDFDFIHLFINVKDSNSPPEFRASYPSLEFTTPLEIIQSIFKSINDKKQKAIDNKEEFKFNYKDTDLTSSRSLLEGLINKYNNDFSASNPSTLPNLLETLRLQIQRGHFNPNPIRPF